MAPAGDVGDGFTASPVGLETRFRLSFGGLGRVGVPVGLGAVPVGRFADVPAVADVGAQPAPGLLQGVEDLVLGDGLVDAPLQDSLGAAAGERDRLVGGEERSVCLLESPFDRQAFEGAPCYARDALADDHIESAVRPPAFDQKVSDAAVTGNRDVEAFVAGTLTAAVQFHPARLDVVEVSDNDPGGRNSGFAVAELAYQRLTWVLLVLGGSSPKKGNSHFAA
ncbi:hypothetical protein MUY14_42950 [Amycolatopsis sp. FBCC-B4732]|uniref:hypothetical protein n=1 Tax=Amycolatopsis sp. FBCC-B4732 TaxID=3079339 RepID=UPI001FF0E721|nr:hypothetical protein [Amycolatopsis sp. FBCC-B4732]UOX88372.1 hypothetical protein MUY14_42950 [Amycolatopsis sp. FBCC-B4732]